MVWSSSPCSLLTRGNGCSQKSVNQAMSRSTSVSTGITGGPQSSNKEHAANGVHSRPSPPSFLWNGSASLDREVLKKLAIGLALTAALLAFIVEKLCAWS
ncbi:hypothetical protein fugu_009829 [Takifugu bimaculatus]|uniref:Uncharacterized protein n=1 Tax=Takifugu bimaculatus TaxID=433685 RepID=A0A4Z2CDM8_9TELE|nr:hypothetical protein fugu_009829 [Takifugu bimaculatus]